MRIKLNIEKSLERNAELYFEKAKKARRKLEGAKEAVERTKKKIEKAKAEQKEELKKVEQKIKIKKEWYEKFRWFISSEGFLCIGGRDAATNEIVIKKHTDPEDIVFHTNMAGSPFFVIKTEKRKPSEKTIEEVAQATASYSKAWKLGISTADVFHVNPDQVTKEALSGEFIPRGAFMIYGKKNELTAILKISIGIKKGKIIGGPVEAIKKNAEKFVIVVQGNDKASAIAKKIKKKLGDGDLDDIIRFLPSGNFALA